MIVFDDADVQSVVEGVRTFGYYNAGQDCTAACRIYAGAKVYDRPVADLLERGEHDQDRLQDCERRGDGALLDQRRAAPDRACSFLR